LAAVVVGRAPFNVEDAVRRDSAGRGEYTQIGARIRAAGAGTQIRSIGEDRIGGCRLRDAIGVVGFVHGSKR
jgi:hypothetical protein